MMTTTTTGAREGYVRLSAPNGIIDTRNGDRFAEAVVKARDAKYFKEADDEEI